jgi:hypothetical protein
MVTVLLASAALALVGCDRQGGGGSGGGAPHVHKAPHGGTVVELGKEAAHLEFVIDRDAGTLTCYVLDSEAEKPVRLKQDEVRIAITWNDQQEGPGSVFALMPVASDLTGEKAGDCSEFRVKDRDIARRPGRFKVKVEKIEVNGQTYTDVEFPFPQGIEAATGAKEAPAAAKKE